MSTPKTQTRKSLRAVRFCTLAGVDSAQLQEGCIVGRFATILKEYYGPKTGTLIEQFVNWSSDDLSWLRFVKRYGPLWENAQHGQSFQSELKGLKGFGETQRVFQHQWRDQHRSGWQMTDKVTVTNLSGHAVLRLHNLHWFLFLDFVTHDPQRLRVCERPDCSTPYFVAHHLGQSYCGSVCAAWAQRKWKTEWWGKHGEEWRTEQRKESIKWKTTKKNRK